jgi:hypothetical protein
MADRIQGEEPLIEVTHADGSRDEMTDLMEKVITHYRRVLEPASERLERTGSHGLTDPDEIRMLEQYHPLRLKRDRELLNLLLFGVRELDGVGKK